MALPARPMNLNRN